jgi:hypothetical protein
MALPRDSKGRAWPRTDPGNPEWEGPWCTTEMDCSICGHEWVAVYPACVNWLECPECNAGYSISRDTDARPTDDPE